jgi:hypothetical protein
VGEKYDDDCDWDYYNEPYLRIRPRLRVSDAIRSGWSPETVTEMAQQWGQGGAEQYSSALGGAVESVQRTRTETEAILRAAGSSRDEQLAAGDRTLNRLNLGINDFSEHLSRNRLLGAALNGHDSVDQADLVRRTLQGSRDATTAVNEHMGFLSSLINQAYGKVADSAMNAVSARTEAAVNRMGELAYSSAADVYRGVFRRGLLEDPGDGTAATASPNSSTPRSAGPKWTPSWRHSKRSSARVSRPPTTPASRDSSASSRSSSSAPATWGRSTSDRCSRGWADSHRPSIPTTHAPAGLRRASCSPPTGERPRPWPRQSTSGPASPTTSARGRAPRATSW